MAGSREHDNELSGSEKVGNFLISWANISILIILLHGDTHDSSQLYLSSHGMLVIHVIYDPLCKCIMLTQNIQFTNILRL